MYQNSVASNSHQNVGISLHMSPANESLSLAARIPRLIPEYAVSLADTCIWKWVTLFSFLFTKSLIKTLVINKFHNPPILASILTTGYLQKRCWHISTHNSIIQTFTQPPMVGTGSCQWNNYTPHQTQPLIHKPVGTLSSNWEWGY